MKILIVANDIFGEVLPMLFSQMSKTEIKVIPSSHKDALELFLLKDPDHVLICECWDKDDTGKITELSKISLEDISNSAGETVLIRTIGFDQKNDLMLPCKIEEVLGVFNTKRN